MNILDKITTVFHSKLFGLVMLLIVVGAVPATIFLAQQQQDIRQRAGGSDVEYITTQVACGTRQVYPQGMSADEICKANGYPGVVQTGGTVIKGWWWRQCNGANVASCTGLDCVVQPSDACGGGAFWSQQLHVDTDTGNVMKPEQFPYKEQGDAMKRFHPANGIEDGQWGSCTGYSPGWTVRVACQPKLADATPTPVLPTPTPHGDPTLAPSGIGTPQPSSPVAPQSVTPVPGSSKTGLFFTVILSGVVDNPVDTTRSLTVEVFSTTDGSKVSESVTGITYDPTSKTFQGGTSFAWIKANGIYNIKVKSKGYLKKLLPAVQLNFEKSNIMQPVTLTPGDMNDDNLIDMQDYNIYSSCFGEKTTCQDPSAVDLNGDGKTDSRTMLSDYLLLIKSFTSKEGD